MPLILLETGRVINPRTFQANTVNNYGPIAVPVGATHIQLAIKRDDWFSLPSDQEVVEGTIEISRDAGITFLPVLSFTDTGGEDIQRNGLPREYSYQLVTHGLLLSVTNPADANTRARGSVNIGNFALKMETWATAFQEI